jgi:hypothetical protein
VQIHSLFTVKRSAAVQVGQSTHQPRRTEPRNLFFSYPVSPLFLEAAANQTSPTKSSVGGLRVGGVRFLQVVVVQQLFDQVHVGEKHTPAAVAREAQSIERLPGQSGKTEPQYEGDEGKGIGKDSIELPC